MGKSTTVDLSSYAHGLVSVCMCVLYYSLGDVFKLALNSSESFNLISGKEKNDSVILT